MDQLSENTIFLLVCMFFSVFCPDRNRNVWIVISSACVLNILLNASVFNKMDSTWLPAWYCTLEVLTIFFLRKFAWNKLGKSHALILGPVFVFHFFLCWDATLGSNLIYDSYETLIRSAMLVQLTLGTNGLFEMALDFYSRCRAYLAYFGKRGTVNEMGYTVNRIKVEETQGAGKR